MKQQLQTSLLRVLLAASLCVAAVLPVSAFVVDGLAYNINPDGKSVKVVPYNVEMWVSNGEYSYTHLDGFYGNVHYPEVYEIMIPDQITYRGKSYNVTGVDAGAFDQTDDIHMPFNWRDIVSVGKNISAIGRYAISCCSSLIINGNIDFIEEQGLMSVSRITLAQDVTSVENLNINRAYGNVSDVVCLCSYPPKADGFIDVSEDSYTFSDVNVYIPIGTLERYSNDDFWRQCRLIESSYPDNISLDQTAITVKVGEPFTIRASDEASCLIPIQWSYYCTTALLDIERLSGNHDRAIQYVGGCALTKSFDTEGEYEIYAFINEVKSPVCHVTVIEDKDVVTLSQTNLQMEIGERQILNVSGLPDGTRVTATSSKASVATTAVSGQRVMVTAVGNGKATITVADSDGKAIPATCEVTVGSAPQLHGDLTSDGVVDVDDLNLVINMMLHKAETTVAADLNGDGNVDVDDLNAIINIMLGKG